MRSSPLRKIYSFILYLLVPFVLLRLFWLGFKNQNYRHRWKERFGFSDKVTAHNKIICLHAVSVGEVQASKPLVDNLLEKYSNYKILITTMTPTGADSVKQCFGETVQHLYLPYDLPVAVRNFIFMIKPSMLIVMETELWPNLFYYFRKNNIPIIIINARMSEKSAKSYKRLSSLTRSTLINISLIIAQGERDAERFIALGAAENKVKITGNLKYDIHFPHSVAKQAQDLRKYFSINRSVWIAASTHEGEEKIILNAFNKVLKQHPECLLVIVPRHPERSASVRSLCTKQKFKVQLKSDNKKCDGKVKVFILDTLGELPMYYAAADVAFVGGSLTKIGGHNMLEPASLGLPVIMGSYVFNFQEISQLLLNKGAAWKVANADELSNRVSDLLGNANLRHSIGERGRNVVLENRGNLEKIMELIQGFFHT